MRCGQNPSLKPQNAMSGTVTHNYYTPGHVCSCRRLPDLRQPSPVLETTNLPPHSHSAQWPREEVLEKNKCGETERKNDNTDKTNRHLPSASGTALQLNTATNFPVCEQ